MTTLNKKNKKAPKKTETLAEYEHRLRTSAKEMSKNFVHTKPIKYLLK